MSTETDDRTKRRKKALAVQSLANFIAIDSPDAYREYTKLPWSANVADWLIEGRVPSSYITLDIQSILFRELRNNFRLVETALTYLIQTVETTRNLPGLIEEELTTFGYAVGEFLSKLYTYEQLVGPLRKIDGEDGWHVALLYLTNMTSAMSVCFERANISDDVTAEDTVKFLHEVFGIVEETVLSLAEIHRDSPESITEMVEYFINQNPAEIHLTPGGQQEFVDKLTKFIDRHRIVTAENSSPQAAAWFLSLSELLGPVRQKVFLEEIQPFVHRQRSLFKKLFVHSWDKIRMEWDGVSDYGGLYWKDKEGNLHLYKLSEPDKVNEKRDSVGLPGLPPTLIERAQNPPPE